MRDSGLEAAIKAAGGTTALGKLLGITSQAISQWERVPANRIIQVERETGVPRHVLRPDLYRADLPSGESARVNGTTGGVA